MRRFATVYGKLEVTLGARLFKIVRYLISGGVATIANLTILFLLVHFGHMHYLPASMAAFILAIAVSFGMQKFWTFHDWPMHDTHAQFVRYLMVILGNLLLNTAVMYLLVEVGELWYLLAQVIATTAVSVTGFFGYHHFVFRARSTLPSP